MKKFLNKKNSTILLLFTFILITIQQFAYRAGYKNGLEFYNSVVYASNAINSLTSIDEISDFDFRGTSQNAKCIAKKILANSIEDVKACNSNLTCHNYLKSLGRGLDESLEKKYILKNIDGFSCE